MAKTHYNGLRSQEVIDSRNRFGTNILTPPEKESLFIKFLEKFKELNISLNDPDVILPKDQTPKVDKYDSMVPESLLRSAFLHNQMCVPDAIGIVNNLIIES